MIKIFIDFDGTITKGDVGNMLFENFGGSGCKKIVNDYHVGKINAIECFKLEAEACGELAKSDLDQFIDKQEIDLSFINFLIFCQTNNSDKEIKCFVISDGLDYYIDRIFKKYNLNSLTYFSNKLDFEEKTNKVRLKLSFPYTDENCDICACCKRNHMLTLTADDDIIVYIGDGFSDRCPVKYADIVFARGELQTYCQEQNITYYLFNSFNDIINRIEEILKHKKIRKRQQAEFNRREVFTSG